MEGSETGGAWVGTGQKRQDGGERDGRRVGGDGALGREDGGERDGRRVDGDGAGEGRCRGARREVHGWGRGWGGKMEGSETGGAGRKMEGSGTLLHHKHSGAVQK